MSVQQERDNPLNFCSRCSGGFCAPTDWQNGVWDTDDAICCACANMIIGENMELKNENQVVQAFLRNISRIPINGELLSVVGTEHETAAGFIDVLARGETTGRMYILEFKHPEGSDKMIGQLARYIGAYVLETGAVRADVFGIAIADNFHPHVKYAASAIQNVLLINYRTDILPLCVPLKDFGNDQVAEISEGKFGYVYSDLFRVNWAHHPDGKFSKAWIQIVGQDAGYSRDVQIDLVLRGEYEIVAFRKLLAHLSEHLEDKKRQVVDNSDGID